MEFIVKTHSVIDLITNSSTELFIDYSGSIDHIKELVNYVLKMDGQLKLTCDDIFEIKIVDSYTGEDWEETEYQENPSELKFIVKDSKYEKLAKLVENVLTSGESAEYSC